MIVQRIAPRYKELYGRRLTLHSQAATAQDEWVIKHLGGKIHGTFLEIGAYDGVYQSNTLCLERDFDWTGLLIEAVPEYAWAATLVRRALVLNTVIGPNDGDRDFYIGGQWSGLVDFTRPNLVQGHKDHKNPVRRLSTVTLQSVLWSADSLLRYRLPPIIDYLSLDVEGAEYPILKSYFQSGVPTPCQFRLMTVEIGEHADDLTPLLNLLMPLGYRLENIVAWEAFFVNRNFH